MSLDGDLQHSLRIGDTVLLYAKEARGYVFSELTSSKHNSVAVTPSAGMGSFREPRFDNVHVATFKVVTANKNKAQEWLSDLKKKIGKREATPQQSGILHRARKAVEAELKENAAEQERLLGAQLVYGDSIQLLHTLTGKYVRVNSTLTSRTENTSLRVELSAENSNSCIFKILPRYKVRSVGDVVGVLESLVLCVSHMPVLPGPRYATMTRSNLRMSRRKASSYTAAKGRLELLTSMSLSTGGP
jgi:inositol 1,4,5-triphosphate receptor type 1